METYTHNCIKCSEKYSDTDPDPYYCESCNEERKVIAMEIDKKLASIPRKEKEKSDLEIYNEMRAARNGKYPTIKDMGITL